MSNQSIAFAFDIDGVLVRSSTPLPGATTALAQLQSLNIPFIFLTNGGGKTERDHVALVSKRLDLTFSPDQFIQSHTPFKDLVPALHDKNILVLGGTGNAIRKVAQAYGFKRVFTPSDILATFPHIYPFSELTQDHHQEHGQPLPLNPDGKFQFSAILVWSSPRDWGLDLQLMLDLLLSDRGYLHTTSLGSDYAKTSPPVYWCNPDLTWATKDPLPRVAQGSFRAALQGLWKAHTGLKNLPNESMVGKPTRATYLYGEKTLQEWNLQLNGFGARPIDTVYMIGDNPASDIQGANAFKSPSGIEWKSILVESGVYQAGEKPAWVPTFVVKDVMAAVDLVLEISGFGYGGEGGWKGKVSSSSEGSTAPSTPGSSDWEAPASSISFPAPAKLKDW